MYGAVFGDIMGSVYELHNSKTENIPLFSADSCFTDDTVMTCAVIDKLLNCDNTHSWFSRTKSARAYAARFQMYYSRYPSAGFGQMFSDWAVVRPPAKQRSYGNGAAMRAAPIGCAFSSLRETLSEAAISCLYTHNHPEAIKGARAIAGCVFLARTGASKGDILQFVRRDIGYPLDVSLAEIRPGYVFNSRSRYTVPPAITAFLESDSYEDAIRKAISIGGDSDTIACMAGGIAHAYYKSIPKDITDRCLGVLDSSLKALLGQFHARHPL